MDNCSLFGKRIGSSKKSLSHSGKTKMAIEYIEKTLPVFVRNFTTIGSMMTKCYMWTIVVSSLIWHG